MRDKAIKLPLSQARRLAMGGKVDRALRGITNVLQSKYSRVSHQKQINNQQISELQMKQTF